MAWTALTSDNLKTRLTKLELNAIPGAARAIGVTAENVMAEAVAQVSREIRGHVAVKNHLGPVGTIPDELDNAALALIRRVMFERVPGLKDLFDATRKTAAEDAQKLLLRVADGKFFIVPPEMPAPTNEQAGNYSSEIISSRPDVVGGGELAGL